MEDPAVMERKGKERKGWIQKAENQTKLLTNQKLDLCESYVILVCSQSIVP